MPPYSLKNIFKSAQLWLQFFFTLVSYSSELEAKFSARHKVERLLVRLFHFDIHFCKLIHILLPLRAPSSNSTLGFWYSEYVSLIWSTIISYVNCFLSAFWLFGCAFCKSYETVISPQMENLIYVTTDYTVPSMYSHFRKHISNPDNSEILVRYHPKKPRNLSVILAERNGLFTDQIDCCTIAHKPSCRTLASNLFMAKDHIIIVVLLVPEPHVEKVTESGVPNCPNYCVKLKQSH